MAYKFVSSKYKTGLIQNEILQEYFLRDIEAKNCLIVSKNIDTGEAEVWESNWDKTPTRKLGKLSFDAKTLTLHQILEKFGVNHKEIPKEAKIVSHSPPFHADDLMACVLIKKYFESRYTPTSIFLTRNQKQIEEADAVVDVGSVHNAERLRFDHHQLKTSDKAATGLVADFLQSQTHMEWVTQLKPTLDKIDKADLGKPDHPNHLTLGEVLTNFNPTWQEKQGNQFFKALSILEESLDIAQELTEIDELHKVKGGEREISTPLNDRFESTLLKHPEIISRGKQVQEAKVAGHLKFIESAIKGQRSGIAETEQGIDFYLLFSQDYLNLAPKEEVKALKCINYITFKASHGALNAIAAPTPNNRMSQKHPFPQTWQGKRGQELVDAISQSTGEKFPPVPPEKANEYFCHNAGFFFTAPNQQIFDKAVEFCARIAKEKEIYPRSHNLTHCELWGRGGPL